MIFRDYIFPGYTRLSRSGRRAARRNSDRGRLLQTAAVLTAAVGIDTSLSLAYQLFALLLAVIIFARLALRFQRPSLHLERRLPRYATAEEPFSYTVNVRNDGRQAEADLRLIDNPRVRPPTYEQYMASREPFEETRNAWDRFVGFHRFIWLQRLNTGLVVDEGRVPTLEPGANVAVSLSATPLRRGIVNLDGLTVLAPDPFSLNFYLDQHPRSDQLLVLPKRYPLNLNKAWQGGRHHQPGGARPAWSVGDSGEFVALRDYRAGDSPRKIHWSSTAKRGKPVVKEFQDEYLVRHTLVLDTDTDDLLLFEEAVAIAASFLVAGSEQENLTDLMFVGDSAVVETAGDPFSSSNHQLQTLATVEPSAGSCHRLGEILAAHESRMSDCIAILCGWDAARQALHEQLRRLAVPVRVLLLSREGVPDSSLGDTPPDSATPVVHDLIHIDPTDVMTGLARL